MSDLVFSKVGDDIIVAGYKVPDGIGSVTYNDLDGNTYQTGGGVSDIFKGLAVPAGLFFMQQTVSSSPVSSTIKTLKGHVEDIVDDSLYDKLLDMVSVSDKKKFVKNTRKNRKYKKNKTRKIGWF